jgi:hypothetical protein
MLSRRPARADERTGMFYLLLSFSIVTLGAGMFVIGFGFPIRETMFGSSLLILGTIAVVGGFVLVGLAAAVQELRRVVQVLRRIPGGPRPLRPAERKEGDRKEGDRRPPPQRTLFPNRPALEAPIPPPNDLDELYGADSGVHADTRPRADFARSDFARSDTARTDTARADAARGDFARADAAGRAGVTARVDHQATERGPAWLRRAIAEIESIPRPTELPPPVAPREPRRYEEPQPVAPLEPRRYEEPQPVRRPVPAEAASGRPGPHAGERAPMQDGWIRSRPPVAPAPAPARESLDDYAPEPDPPPRKPIAPLPNIFDMVWANDRRRPASESAPPPEQPSEAPSHPPVRSLEPTPAPVVQSTPAPMPRPEPRPESRVEPRPEPRPELRSEARAEPRPEPPPEPRPAPRPLSILKSGVIDEMAYTLFTDGSIEAQMPDGTMRFSSIEELRRHLDQHDG